VAVGRNARGRFVKGWQGGPGRPLGKKNHLTEAVLGALSRDFQAYGESVIEEVRTKTPGLYLRIVTSLCPRELKVERTSPLGDLSDQELALLEEQLVGVRARLVQQIERAQSSGAAVIEAPAIAIEPEHEHTGVAVIETSPTVTVAPEPVK